MESLKTKASNLPEKEEPKITFPTNESLENLLNPEEINKIPKPEAPKQKYKLHTLDIYVIFSIASLIAYTIVSQWMVVVFGVSLDELTRCFFGCFGGEILAACLIKIFKLKKKGNDIGGNEE